MPGPESKAEPLSGEVAYFGRRVKQFRVEAGLTQKQLADAADLGHGQVGHIETGIRELGIGHVWQLALALGKTPADLFGDPPPRADEPERL